MKITHVNPKPREKSPKQVLREQLRGKKTLSAADKEALFLQMAIDLGYLDGRLTGE